MTDDRADRRDGPSSPTSPTDHNAPQPSPQTDQRLVVGVDGSAGSVAALRWSLTMAGRFGSVQPILAWQYGWWSLSPAMPGGMPDLPDDGQLHAEGRRIVAQAIEGARTTSSTSSGDQILEPISVHGSAGATLVDAAAGSDTLVVGTRGHGAVVGTVLGSVSHHCVHHATTPVVVVPASFDHDHHGHPLRRVVVGVDGSRHSATVLSWTLDHTDADTDIEAVHVWDVDDIVAVEPVPTAAERIEALSHDMVEQLVDSVTGAVAHRGRKVVASTRRGDPRSELRAAAEGCDLLVVGARGHERVPHLMIGSVSAALVTDPAVPTAVVRLGSIPQS